MGQKPSRLGGSRTNKSKLPISWILRGQQITHTPQPEQPIKFQYKTRRKSSDQNKHKYITEKYISEQSFKKSEQVKTLNNLNCSTNKPSVVNSNNVKNKKVNDFNNKRSTAKIQNAPIRTKSEPSLNLEKVREKHRYRRKSTRDVPKYKNEGPIVQQFGYEIEDVDGFLTKATIEKPANIPVVLAFPTTLYQTRMSGFQTEIQLPLGMVVNAVFKNQNWLYVQTPHTEEGYVSYTACLPLGIIPPPEDFPLPCWENNTDIFPKPSGNMTDTEKLSSRSECSVSRCHSRRSRNAFSQCEEESVDRLYLQAAACAKIKGIKQTLLVICRNYNSKDENSLSVLKGDVVALIDNHLQGWFWVRNKSGAEGFIPSEVAGHGFL